MGQAATLRADEVHLAHGSAGLCALRWPAGHRRALGYHATSSTYACCRRGATSTAYVDPLVARTMAAWHDSLLSPAAALVLALARLRRRAAHPGARRRRPRAGPVRLGVRLRHVHADVRAPAAHELGRQAAWAVVLLAVVGPAPRTRWWWLAGKAVGLATYDKWLVVVLVVAVLVGSSSTADGGCSPPRASWARLAVLLALQNVLWQDRHGLRNGRWAGLWRARTGWRRGSRSSRARDHGRAAALRGRRRRLGPPAAGAGMARVQLPACGAGGDGRPHRARRRPVATTLRRRGGSARRGCVSTATWARTSGRRTALVVLVACTWRRTSSSTCRCCRSRSSAGRLSPP